uniref:Uncharacterized protein n=1 Tax=Sphaerodactylus townsendi TaxID=933632 RepID=A0ACB8F927_9SAUR
MEEESMEEEEGGGGGGSLSSSSSYEALMDDQNHNNWEAAGGGRGSYTCQPLSPEGPRGEVAPSLDPQKDFEMQMLSEAANGSSKGAAAGGINLNINSSTSKFLMNVITIEEYKSTYWPKLDSAIDQLLTQSPGDYIPISYEQIYRCKIFYNAYLMALCDQIMKQKMLKDMIQSH